MTRSGLSRCIARRPSSRFEAEAIHVPLLFQVGATGFDKVRVVVYDEDLAHYAAPSGQRGMV
jgi:hypothetical protein